MWRIPGTTDVQEWVLGTLERARLVSAPILCHHLSREPQLPWPQLTMSTMEELPFGMTQVREPTKPRGGSVPIIWYSRPKLAVWAHYPASLHMARQTRSAAGRGVDPGLLGRRLGSAEGSGPPCPNPPASHPQGQHPPTFPTPQSHISATRVPPGTALEKGWESSEKGQGLRATLEKAQSGRFLAK